MNFVISLNLCVSFLGTFCISNVAAGDVVGWVDEDKPTQAPTNFTLVQIVTGTTALLSWNPVPPETIRGHFKGYKIQTWVDGEEHNLKEILVKADATKTLVSKFKPFSKNNAQIMVYNRRYNGPPSKKLTFFTPEGKPGTVKSFQAYPIGSSAMLLTWDKPVEKNGILTGYKIYYQKLQGPNLGPLQERENKIDPKFDRAKLADLEPNTKYRIQIRAMTKAGEGHSYYVEETTKSVVYTKPDTPVFQASTLPAKEGTAHILVRWMPSLDGHAGTHFVAWYRPKGWPDWSQTIEETEEDFVILTGLKPGQIYEVKISAHDGEFYSMSEVQEVNTTNGECTHHDDCPTNQVCKVSKCVDPCEGLCGNNAICLQSVSDRNATCSCKDNFTGNPYIECSPTNDPEVKHEQDSTVITNGTTYIVIWSISAIIAVIATTICCYWCTKKFYASKNNRKNREEPLVYSYVPVERVTPDDARAMMTANKQLGEQSFIPRIPLRPHEYSYDYTTPPEPDSHIYEYVQ